MRSFVAVLLLATLGATSAGTTVTVQRSNINFRDMHAACPAGSLAGIAFTLGHVRIAEMQDVESDIDSANVNAQVITLTKGEQTAVATADAAKDTVTAKHVTLQSRNRVACVAPD